MATHKNTSFEHGRLNRSCTCVYINISLKMVTGMRGVEAGVNVALGSGGGIV